LALDIIEAALSGVGDVTTGAFHGQCNVIIAGEHSINSLFANIGKLITQPFIMML
jgi:hypothetical protein